jgi:hypothetical protein
VLGAGHILIRTVWLGLFLLICLVALASFKLAFGPSPPVALAKEAAFVAPSEDMPTVGATGSETLTKSDRLEISYVPPANEAKPVAVEDPRDPLTLSAPAAATSKLVSRHWHDPSDTNAAQVQTKKFKLKDTKKNALAVGRTPTIEATSCKPEGLDALRRAFNVTTSCAASN